MAVNAFSSHHGRCERYPVSPLDGGESKSI
jgi:hypothetical protein